jgi:hypothetical protein
MKAERQDACEFGGRGSFRRPRPRGFSLFQRADVAIARCRELILSAHDGIEGRQQFRGKVPRVRTTPSAPDSIAARRALGSPWKLSPLTLVSGQRCRSRCSHSRQPSRLSEMSTTAAFAPTEIG